MQVFSPSPSDAARPADNEADRLSSPTVYLWAMVVFLALAGFVVMILGRQVVQAFTTNPGLKPADKVRWVKCLMQARNAVRFAKNKPDALAAARAAVNRAKEALGERGPVWWTDGAPDYNRHLAKNTPYANWFDDLVATDRA